jgi:SAM-dependent methyltransferase
MRDWRLKAAAQKVLSAVPGGYGLNYRLQRAVGSFPLSDREIDFGIRLATTHVANFVRYGSRPLPEARTFEFGAGWDLHIPLMLSALGARHQIVVDIRDHLRPELVDDTVRRLPDHRPDTLGEWEPPRPPAGVELRRWLLEEAGIDFRAPCDARATGLPDGSIDLITSTATLEHIPPDDILRILVECRRLLAPGGIVSCNIDYGDHYSYFDNTLGPYHFLTFPERRWRWLNSDMQFQNRMRHSQYLDMVEEAGFTVIDESRSGGSADDIAVVEALDLAEPFDRMDPADVAVQSSFLTLRPRT